MKYPGTICQLTGTQYPLIQGGMAWVSDANLAAAVSMAGGLGVIAAGNAPPDWVETQVKLLREKTDKPFGLNVMLLSHAKWRTFTDRPIPPKTSSEVGLNISCKSREEVDAMNKCAAEHGGIADINPVEDHGFMYGRDFTDLDGHIWGAQWMDPAALSPVDVKE